MQIRRLGTERKMHVIHSQILTNVCMNNDMQIMGCAHKAHECRPPHGTALRFSQLCGGVDGGQANFWT